MKPKLLRLHSQDNIVVATAPIKAESVLKLDRVKIQIVSNVPMAGKVATRPIAEGEKILKFGQPIGHATRNIEPGEWVHTHNLASDYFPTPEPHSVSPGITHQQTSQPLVPEQSADGPVPTDSQASEECETQSAADSDVTSEPGSLETSQERTLSGRENSRLSSLTPNEAMDHGNRQLPQADDGGTTPHEPNADS